MSVGSVLGLLFCSIDLYVCFCASTILFWLLSFFKLLFIYLFIIFGCVGSSFLCEGFLQLGQAGATLHRGARASHCRGLSRCGAQAPDAQAQQLWLTGLVALRHVASSQTRAWTRVPCIGRQILNHCATIWRGTWFLGKINELISGGEKYASDIYDFLKISAVC